MKKPLLFIFCFISLSSFSQSWFPIGAKWYQPVYYQPGLSLLGIGYNIYEVKSDTVIDGFIAKNIQIIEVKYDGSLKIASKIIMREEAGRVYYYGKFNYNSPKQFFLMYDFNLSAGDTLPITNNWECDSIKLTIDSIKTEDFLGTTLKKIYATSYGKDSRHTQQYKHEIIERIGAINYLEQLRFFPEIDCIGLNDNFYSERPISCYSDNEVSINFTEGTANYLPCDTLIDLTVSTNPLSQNSLQISPNPTTGFVRLNNLPDGFKTIQVLSLQGAVLREENTSSKTTELDLSAFPTGVYFITLSTETGQVFTGKIVKQ